ncbi:MAG: helix-turn-helix domain-containing protein [Xanthomonadaceae bacterium]|nr:helix-turn-helix domain-containing protein [Xanthomonadaceae bacterium]
MKFQDLHHDPAALAELGHRLAQVRIDQQLTQAELARKAGVGKRTLERLEAGETTQTRTLFRVLRELDLLKRLEVLLPEPTLRPSQATRKADALPKRATSKRANRERAKEAGDKQWKWGDER